MLGISLVLVGLVPLLRLVGVPERAAYTSCGLAISVAMLLPWDIWESVFGQMSMDYSTWIVSGLMTVIGAVWVMVYNADLILRAVSFACPPSGDSRRSRGWRSRIRFGHASEPARRSPCSRSSSSRSSRNGHPELLRQGLGNVEEFGGGFEFRAGTSASAPIDDLQAALRGRRVNPLRVLGGRQPVGALGEGQAARRRPSGELRGARPRSRVPRALDLRPRRNGQGVQSADEVWKAIATRPGLAVVDGRRAAPGQLEPGSSSRLPALRLLRRGRRLRPDPAHDPRSADPA